MDPGRFRSAAIESQLFRSVDCDNGPPEREQNIHSVFNGAFLRTFSSMIFRAILFKYNCLRAFVFFPGVISFLTLIERLIVRIPF